MPVPLEPADRKLLIIAGLVLLAVVVIAVAVVPPRGPESTGIPSSYSAASDGTKAGYMLLKELGYRTERWEKPPTVLPSNPSGELLVLLEPLFPASAEERQAIHAFVRAGGRVLASGPSAAALLPEGGALDHEPVEFGWKRYRAVVPSPLTRGAPEITMEPRARWQMSHFAHLGIFAERINSVVVSYAYGKGQVIWWAAPTPLTNAGLKQPGNLNLLLNSLGGSVQTRVLWDEYYHGQRGTLWSYFAGTPLPWGLLQLALVALTLLATFSRRAGLVRAPVVAARLSPLEFVETLGDLYHRAHAAGAAVETSLRRFRFLLTRRLGLASTASISQVHEAAHDRLGWKQPGLLETLLRADRASRSAELTDAEALPIVQALEQYAGLLHIRPRKGEEGRAWRNK